MIQVDVMKLIVEERKHQIAGGYTAAHDDTHELSDWLTILQRELGLAAGYSMEGATDDVEEQLVKIASVAVAALECRERRLNWIAQQNNDKKDTL